MTAPSKSKISQFDTIHEQAFCTHRTKTATEIHIIPINNGCSFPEKVLVVIHTHPTLVLAEHSSIPSTPGHCDIADLS